MFVTLRTAEEIADDDDDGDDYNDDVIREVLGTNQSIGEHAFSKMEENVDKQRLMKNRMSPAVLATEEERREVWEGFFIFILLDLARYIRTDIMVSKVTRNHFRW